jgi:hypothetical protein
LAATTDVTLVFTDVTPSMNTNKPLSAMELRIGMQRWRWYSPIDIGVQGGCGGMNEYQMEQASVNGMGTRGVNRRIIHSAVMKAASVIKPAGCLHFTSLDCQAIVTGRYIQ